MAHCIWGVPVPKSSIKGRDKQLHAAVTVGCNYFSLSLILVFGTQTLINYVPRMSSIWPHFYQTGSAQSMDQGSTMKRSAVHNFAPTVTKFCVMWEGQALPHDTQFGNSRCEIVGRRVIFIWSLIHGLRWSGLIKAEPEWITDTGGLFRAYTEVQLDRHQITVSVELNLGLLAK